MILPIASQLRAAWLQSGVRLDELCHLANLSCSADSLSRKLSSKQILTTAEAEAIAQALDCEITWTPARRARRRAA